MESINENKVVLALLLTGFEKVDEMLLDYTMMKLLFDLDPPFALDNDNSEELESIIHFDGTFYRLNQEIISESSAFSQRKALEKKPRLLDCFSHWNFIGIIFDKIKEIGMDKLSDNTHLFSNKEKELLFESVGFDIFKPVRKERVKSIQEDKRNKI